MSKWIKQYPQKTDVQGTDAYLLQRGSKYYYMEQADLFAGIITTTGLATGIIPRYDGSGFVDSYLLQSGNNIVLAAAKNLSIGTGDITMNNLTANRALYLDGSKNIKTSAVTSTELGYLSGVTSAIQTQLNAIAATTLSTVLGNGNTTSAHNIILSNNDKLINAGGDYYFSFPSGTSMILGAVASNRYFSVDANNVNISSGASVSAVFGSSLIEFRAPAGTQFYEDVILGTRGGVDGVLKMAGSGSSNYLRFKCTGAASDITYILPTVDPVAGQVLTSTAPSGGVATLSWATASAGTVTSVSGTSNRITSTGGATPVIDISASYVGQASITTLGTIGTGVWQGTVVNPTYGGTGVNNGANTITLAGNLVTTGAFNTTFAASATGTYTLPSATSTLLANNLGLSGNTVFIGGTATSGSLTLQSTSGVGATDFIKFLVGNNGATEAARFLTSGALLMGRTMASSEAGKIEIQTANAAYGITITNGTAKFATYMDTNIAYFGTISNSSLDFFINNGVSRFRVAATTGNCMFSNNVYIGSVSGTPTAKLHFSASSGSANTASIQVENGTREATARAGIVEFENNWYNTTNTLVRYAGGGTIFDYNTDVGNGTTVETDLYTSTTIASTLAVNKDKLEAMYGGVFISSATATRQIKIYFGGTAIFDSGALTLSLSSAWTCYVDIIRVNSTTIRYSITLTTEGAALAAYTAVNELSGLTLSNTNILKITGQAAGVGAATNDIVAKMGWVKFHGAA